MSTQWKNFTIADFPAAASSLSLYAQKEVISGLRQLAAAHQTEYGKTATSAALEALATMAKNDHPAHLLGGTTVADFHSRISERKRAPHAFDNNEGVLGHVAAALNLNWNTVLLLHQFHIRKQDMLEASGKSHDAQLAEGIGRFAETAKGIFSGVIMRGAATSALSASILHSAHQMERKLNRMEEQSTPAIAARHHQYAFFTALAEGVPAELPIQKSNLLQIAKEVDTFLIGLGRQFPVRPGTIFLEGLGISNMPANDDVHQSLVIPSPSASITPQTRLG